MERCRIAIDVIQFGILWCEWVACVRSNDRQHVPQPFPLEYLIGKAVANIAFKQGAHHHAHVAGIVAAPFSEILKPHVILQIAFLGSEEHTSELQSLMRISYAVFCLKKKRRKQTSHHT